MQTCICIYIYVFTQACIRVHTCMCPYMLFEHINIYIRTFVYTYVYIQWAYIHAFSCWQLLHNIYLRVSFAVQFDLLFLNWLVHLFNSGFFPAPLCYTQEVLRTQQWGKKCVCIGQSGSDLLVFTSLEVHLHLCRDMCIHVSIRRSYPRGCSTSGSWARP